MFKTFILNDRFWFFSLYFEFPTNFYLYLNDEIVIKINCVEYNPTTY